MQKRLLCMKCLFFIMGPTGFDDKLRNNVSMRGVVSSTSTNKLAANLSGKKLTTSKNNALVVSTYNVNFAAVA